MCDKKQKYWDTGTTINAPRTICHHGFGHLDTNCWESESNLFLHGEWESEWGVLIAVKKHEKN